jgi:hypothetical protein
MSGRLTHPTADAFDRAERGDLKKGAVTYAKDVARSAVAI